MGYTHHEQRSARPTLRSTALPVVIRAKAVRRSCCLRECQDHLQLVSNQDPREINRLLKRQLKKLCLPSVKLKLRMGSGARSCTAHGLQAQVALEALREAFGHEPVICGKAVRFQLSMNSKKCSGRPLLLGLALPDDNLYHRTRSSTSIAS